MKKRVLIIALVVVALGTLTAGAALTLGDDRVATLDGEAVTRDELLFQMQRSGTSAQQALEEIRSNHALLELAEEQGLVAATDYEAS